MPAKSEKHFLKTVREVNYTISIPYNAKSCLKWLSSKGRNSVKIKNSHAHLQHLQYVHNMSAMFEKHLLKTVGEVDHTDSAPHNSKVAKKDQVQKAVILSKLILAPSKHTGTSSLCPQQVCKVWRRSIENCGRSWLYTLHCKVWQIDGQTGAILNAPPPDYRHGGIKMVTMVVHSWASSKGVMLKWQGGIYDDYNNICEYKKSTTNIKQSNTNWKL